MSLILPLLTPQNMSPFTRSLFEKQCASPSFIKHIAASHVAHAEAVLRIAYACLLLVAWMFRSIKIEEVKREKDQALQAYGLTLHLLLACGNASILQRSCRENLISSSVALPPPPAPVLQLPAPTLVSPSPAALPREAHPCPSERSQRWAQITNPVLQLPAPTLVSPSPAALPREAHSCPSERSQRWAQITNPVLQLPAPTLVSPSPAALPREALPYPTSIEIELPTIPKLWESPQSWAQHVQETFQETQRQMIAEKETGFNLQNEYGSINPASTQDIISCKLGNPEIAIGHYENTGAEKIDSQIATQFNLEVRGEIHSVQLFGIFHGHGSGFVSNYIKSKIVETTSCLLKQTGCTSIEIANAIIQTFTQLDHQFKNENRYYFDVNKKEFVTYYGATATVVLCVDNRIFAANLGGGRAVWIKRTNNHNYQTKQLTLSGKSQREEGIGFNNASVNHAPLVNMITSESEGYLFLGSESFFKACSTAELGSVIAHHSHQRSSSDLVSSLISSAWNKLKKPSTMSGILIKRATEHAFDFMHSSPVSEADPEDTGWVQIDTSVDEAANALLYGESGPPVEPSNINVDDLAALLFPDEESPQNLPPARPESPRSPAASPQPSEAVELNFPGDDLSAELQSPAASPQLSAAVELNFPEDDLSAELQSPAASPQLSAAVEVPFSKDESPEELLIPPASPKAASEPASNDRTSPVSPNESYVNLGVVSPRSNPPIKVETNSDNEEDIFVISDDEGKQPLFRPVIKPGILKEDRF